MWLKITTSCHCIQLFLYYNIENWSHKLLPLTKLLYNKTRFKWMQVEQDDFDKIKRIMARDNLPTYPDSSETFKIHTNASAFQLGEFIR